jgi:sugar transferase (PEP-CTERM/EpsH1 system associated)
VSVEENPMSGASAPRDILFLSHRIPYPPNKGDKIRAWHLLKHLAGHARVHVGAFVDDPDDMRHADALRAVCGEVHLVALDPRMAKLRSLTGLLGGEALSLPYYRDASMQGWVRYMLATHPIRDIVLYSSAVAQYVMDATHCTRIMDFVDIDSDKWRQYAPTQRWPLSWVYRREADRLLEWERRVARELDASLFVSRAEAEDFRRLAPESAARIGWYANGVDADYFSPAHDFANPFETGTRALVFTGAMDYWPNVDAVTWFAREVFPELRRAHPEARFVIVGSRPAPQVRALASLPGIVVTGFVEDVRPYLAHAALAVAPLRIARGIQNKVLEAMAMACTVVASPAAFTGIEAEPGRELLLADTAREWVDGVEAALAPHAPDLGPAARECVLARYGWEANLAVVRGLLDEAAKRKP